jgi:signal transduction histidine kinase
MQAIGTLAGGIAHDFNNILTAIMGYAELSQSQCEKNSIVYSNLNEIVKGTDRASQLVNQILKFSRKSENDVLSVNLDSIVKDVLKLMRASVPADVNVMYEAHDSFYIKADPTQVSQIIMNLCTNAYQALEGKAGCISIKIFKKELSQKKGIEIGNLKKGVYVCMQIEDNGVGSPPEYIHRIFEPFFTTKKLHEGTGLGLSVVHGIVNDHRGGITVESIPGKGSCFTVYFPESKSSGR